MCCEYLDLCAHIAVIVPMISHIHLTTTVSDRFSAHTLPHRVHSSPHRLCIDNHFEKRKDSPFRVFCAYKQAPAALKHSLPSSHTSQNQNCTRNQTELTHARWLIRMVYVREWSTHTGPCCLEGCMSHACCCLLLGLGWKRHVWSTYCSVLGHNLRRTSPPAASSSSYFMVVCIHAPVSRLAHT